jgi:uncharacterized protein YbaR (Trm112 family)
MIDQLAHVLAKSGSLAASTRVILLVLAAIMLALLGVVVALALALRRRQVAHAPRGAEAERDDAAGDRGDDAPAARSLELVACPTCRREYEGGLRYCPRDARALVPAAELAERARSAGATCPRCRRSFDASLRYCPYDAADLVPAAVYDATRDDPDDDDSSGRLGRICPRCRRRYDLVASFCGRDGSELAVLN